MNSVEAAAFSARAGGDACHYCLLPYSDHESSDQIWDHERAFTVAQSEAKRQKADRLREGSPQVRRDRLAAMRDRVYQLEREESAMKRRFYAAKDKETRKTLIVERERLWTRLAGARQEIADVIRACLGSVTR